jgi:hypothetical protein
MSDRLRSSLAELLQAIESCSVSIDTETTAAVQRATRLEDAINAARALLAEAQPARLRYCDVHGQQPDNAWGCPECVREMRQQLAEAQPAQPEPVEPTDEELAGLWTRYTDGLAVGCRPVAFARAVLARWGRPAPEPVSVAERMPTAADCDAEGRCWWFEPADDVDLPTWSLVVHPTRYDTHWLPHWGMPVPQEQADYNHNS